MSRDNVETAKRAVAALNDRDLARLLAEYHPEVVLSVASSATPEPAVHRGINEAGAFLDEIWTTLEGFEAEIARSIEVGDRIVFLVHFVGRGAGSGASVRQQFGWFYAFRDGKICRIDVFGSWAETLEAVGFSE